MNITRMKKVSHGCAAWKIATFIMVCGGLSGCAAKFTCGAPDGFGCKSISEVYSLDEQGVSARDRQSTRGSQDKKTRNVNHAKHRIPSVKGRKEAVADKPTLGVLQPTVRGQTGAVGQPIFRNPRRIRIWIVDWEDESGLTYVPNHYVHTRLDEGEWVMPEIRLRLVEGLADGE